MIENKTHDVAQLEKELVITRVFDAPRELVYRAWTDPRMMAQWWGPHHFTAPVCELDVRPGGAIRIHMQGPDGTIYPMTGTFQEVDAPSRLIFVSAANDNDGQPLFEILNTITLDEQEGKTTLTLRAKPFNLTAAAALPLSGMEEGWNQTLDKLAAFVTEGVGSQ